MARFAIVLAVSDNVSPFRSLAACANDGAAFAAVLGETGRFDEILTLSGENDTSSLIVKERIAAICEKYKEEIVEEVVFYYSGHGEFVGDEFYHILSDYNATRRNQTALSNSEIDGLIRALSPELFVKIVDACYSGTSYVKSDEDLRVYLKGSEPSFKNIYFLYSSQGDERSWTAGNLSAFTTSILESIAVRESGHLRYRDIMNAASDYFLARGGQTPQFVAQAAFTEIFCEASVQLSKVIKKYLPDTPINPAPVKQEPLSTEPSKSASLVERIKEASANYVTQDEATAALDGFAKRLSEVKLSGDLNELFEFYSVLSDEEAHSSITIGEWLEKQTDNELFAIPYYKTVTTRKRSQKTSTFPSQSSYIRRLLNAPGDLWIEEKRQVLDGYRNTADLPFDSMKLRLNPKFSALAPEECVIAPVLSRTGVRVFWFVRHLKYSDWDTTVPSESKPQWKHVGASLRSESELNEIFQRIIAEFFAFAERRLHDRWPAPEMEKDKPRIGRSSNKARHISVNEFKA